MDIIGMSIRSRYEIYNILHCPLLKLQAHLHFCVRLVLAAASYYYLALYTLYPLYPLHPLHPLHPLLAAPMLDLGGLGFDLGRLLVSSRGLVLKQIVKLTTY